MLGRAANDPSGLRPLQQCLPERRPQLLAGPRDLRQSEAFERPVALTHVAVAEAIGDHRAAADQGFEHGQAGARMHQGIGGGEDLAHPVGEAHRQHAEARPRTAGEPGCACPRCARTGTGPESPGSRAQPEPRRSGRRPPSRRPTRRSPSSRVGRPRAFLASALARGFRNAGETGGRAQRTLPGPAIRSTSSLDSGWVMKCRSIPGCAQNCRPARSVIDE